MDLVTSVSEDQYVSSFSVMALKRASALEADKSSDLKRSSFSIRDIFARAFRCCPVELSGAMRRKKR
jgi:hypothetical protein